MRRFLPIGSTTRVGLALAMQQLPSAALNAEVRNNNNTVGTPLCALAGNAATSHHRLFSTTSFALAPEASASQAKLRSGSASMGKGNYFAFFDFPVDPALDVAVLQKRYHALQRQFHPDQRQQQEELGKRPAGQDAEQDTSSDGSQATSSEMDAVSTYANEAYSVLKDPFLRCRYLNKWRRATERKNNNNAVSEEASLSTVALTVEEEETLAIDDDRAVKDKENAALEDLDEEFLMEMMIMNELIFTGDRNQEMIRNQLLVLKADLKERNEEQFDLAKECWAEKDWRGFTACIHKWTYTWNAWNNLIDRL